MKSKLTTVAVLIAFIGTSVFLSFPYSCPQIAAQTPEQGTTLQRVLPQIEKSRREYIKIFRELTAQETKLTEIFDEHGKLKTKRKVVSDFLVYPSQINADVVSEYRVAREIDDKPIRNGLREGENLLHKLAKTKTLPDEHKRLREQNMKYNLHYYRWDVTLNPARQLEEVKWLDYIYEIVGSEKLGSREMIVLSYRRKSFDAVQAKGIFSDFTNPQVSDRGTLWVDAQTFNICQWVNELVVRHAETGNALVVMRDQVEYSESSFGILVPKTITITFFDRLNYKPSSGTPPRTLPGGRITYLYDSFKRFSVTTDYELNKPPNPKE